MVYIGPERIELNEVKAKRVGTGDTLPAAVTVGSAAIAARLRRAILDGRYADGERLPAERNLAQHFEASRSTVREALRRLEEAHLVIRRIGSGTFVSHRPTLEQDDIAEVTSPVELIDVRLAVEPQMARLVVVNATQRDLERMGEALSRVEACDGDRELFSRADEQFHLALAECTRNPLMVWLYRQINDVRSHALWDGMKDKILTKARIAEYNRQHRELYESLCSRDVDAATQMIAAHLEKARRDLLGVDSQ
jgi:DNA-binding FadR family transcriptional regulator